MLTINALAASDSVIIPVQPDFLSVKGLEQLLVTIRKVKRQINPGLKIDGILMTIVADEMISAGIGAVYDPGSKTIRVHGKLPDDIAVGS